MVLLKHFSLINLASEQPFSPKANVEQVASETGDMPAWKAFLAGCVFQIRGMQTFDPVGKGVGRVREAIVLCSELK